jgi:hypothetical protein
MSAPVVTKLEAVIEDATWTKTPYALEVKGKPEPRVNVAKILDPDTGAKTVRIVALATAGVPVLSLALLDYVARSILPTAKISTYSKAEAGNRIVREYASN